VAPVPDVVIAGYGPAGAAAAIAAHDAGRSVLILESAERGGGNARYSGGFLFDVPGDAAVAHLDALCFGRTGRRVLEAYAAGLHELDGWLCSLGGSTVPFEPPPARLPAPFPSWPYSPAGRQIRYRTVAGGTGRRGEALWGLLDTAVRARGIEVRYRCAAERLVLDRDGSATGVVAHARRRVRRGPGPAGAAPRPAAGRRGGPRSRSSPRTARPRSPARCCTPTAAWSCAEFRTAMFMQTCDLTTSAAGRNGTGVSLRQDALDPGFHGVPAGPAYPDRDADGAGVT
jgi:FAD binding domain